MVISHSFYKRLPEGSAAGALATIMGMFHDVPRNISWLKSAPNIYRSPSYIIQHIHTYPKLHRMTMYDYRCHFLDTHTQIERYIYISYLVYLYIACSVMAEPRKNRILPRGKARGSNGGAPEGSATIPAQGRLWREQICC